MLTAEHFGGRRAFVRHLLEYTKARIGMYAALSRLEWNQDQRLVFVCEGNICRSPYAESRARASGFKAISLGLSAREGAAADARAMQSALMRGLDLSGHRSIRFDPTKLQDRDLLLFFEPEHLYAVRAKHDISPYQCSLLGLWARPRRPYISDPYGKSVDYFQTCFSVIDDSIERIAAKTNLADER